MGIIARAVAQDSRCIASVTSDSEEKATVHLIKCALEHFRNTLKDASYLTPPKNVMNGNIT